MNYQDWLKAVRRDARFREKLETSTRLIRQRERFVSFISATVDERLRRGQSIDEIIRETKALQLIPKDRVKEFTNAIRQNINTYAEFRKKSERDLGVNLSKSEIQQIQALSDFERKIEIQSALDTARALDRARLVPKIRKQLARGAGREQITQELRNSDLKAHAQVEANLALQEFNNRYSFAVANQSQIKTFEYYGPSDSKTRPFCLGLAGYRFQESQIEQMVNGLGFPVRETCGGPNFRHEWLAVPLQFQSEEPEKMVTEYEYVELGKNKRRPMRVYLTEENRARVKALFQE